MYKSFKALHILGLALFLGSVFGHIALGALPGVATDPPAILFGRQAIAAATRFVTLPGLALAMASGLALTLHGRHGFGRLRWLSLHQVLGFLIALNAFFILAPTGREALAAAEALSTQTGGADALAALIQREMRFGPINVVLTLVTVALGVGKPALGQAGGAR